MGPSANLSAGAFVSSVSPAADYEEPRKASALPVILAIVLLTTSVVVWLLDFQGIYPFTYNYFNLVGYLLTPFLVFMCVAWDAAAQRAGRRSPWFDIRPGYSRALRVIAVIALAVSVPHILEMSRTVGEWVVQTGLLS
jgi:purine-cytosine permease-like protein